MTTYRNTHSKHNNHFSQSQADSLNTLNESVFESSELSVSSTPSVRVQTYLKQHNIPNTHINKHFTFKSINKWKDSPDEKKKRSKKSQSHFIGYIPSASHSIIHINQTSNDSNHENINTDDSDSNISSTSTSNDSPCKQTSRTTKHHWWTRMTIQCACCGICIVEFGWTIVECLIIPYLFLSNTPYYCLSFILFFIPIFDSWLQPLIYIWFNKIIYKHHNYYYAQLMLFIFTILFLIGFIILPHSNVISVQLFQHHNNTKDIIINDIKKKETLNCSIIPFRMGISIIGYTIINLSLGYLLIPLRLIMNDSMAKISSKQFFSLRKKAISNIYNDVNRQYLSLKAEKNYILSFDVLATQIYNINEYNHYLKYCQSSISTYQIIGRCLGYSFASIDWLSFASIDWIFAHKYGHIDICFTFTCGITICGLFILTLFTIYVHIYAIKKIKKKKKKIL